MTTSFSEELQDSLIYEIFLSIINNLKLFWVYNLGTLYQTKSTRTTKL